VSEELTKAADVTVNEVLAVKKGEHVLIVTNPVRDVYKISQAVYASCLRAEASPVLMVQPEKTQFDFAEPAVISAIKSEPDVVISVSAEKLGKDREALVKPYIGADGKPYNHIFDQLLHGVKKIRAFWSPKITTDMFVRTVPIDYPALRQTCAKVEAKLKNAKEVYVETALGTKVTVSVKGRKPRVDDGDFRSPGKGGNLPAGEIYISPTLGESNGVIVFDGSVTLDKTLVIKEPVKITLKKGFVTGLMEEEKPNNSRAISERLRRNPSAWLRKATSRMKKRRSTQRTPETSASWG